MSKPHEPLTLKDLARHLGISPATVSTVLNNKHQDRRISAATVDAVRQAARELGYRPDVRARRMRSRPGERPWVVAIISAVESPIDYIGPLLRTLDTMTTNAGGDLPPIEVNVALFHGGRLRELSGLADGSLCNGAIITNSRPEDDAWLAETTLPMPTILWGRTVPGYSSLRTTHDTGGEAAQELQRVGAKHLAVIVPPYLTETTAGRLASFDAMAEKLYGRPADHIATGAISEHHGHIATRDYLAGGGQADGLFTMLDTYAVGAYRAIRESGRRVPDDFLVIGHDDRPIAQYLEPPLTTFAAVASEMRRSAVEMLMSQLNGTRPEVRTEIFECKIQRRASTARPPA